MKRLLIVLAMLGILGIACSMTTTVAPTALPAATYTMLPTYTPYPTLAQPTALPYVAPTAKAKQGASDENTCAMKISGAGITFYSIITGSGVAAFCPTLVQKMRAADTDSLLSITIVSTFPTEPVICHKDFGSGIEAFVIDTNSDTSLSQAFCGGLS